MLIPSLAALFVVAFSALFFRAFYRGCLGSPLWSKAAAWKRSAIVLSYIFVSFTWAVLPVLPISAVAKPKDSDPPYAVKVKDNMKGISRVYLLIVPFLIAAVVLGRTISN
jgi:hypothetical protein